MSSESTIPATSSTDMTTPSENGTKQTVICVFCGSSAGDPEKPVHLEAARGLAHTFHKHSIKLVYGAGTKGIMGEVARTLVSLSGKDAVHGFIPRALQKHEQEGGSSEEIGNVTVVQDMHTRKRMMAQEVAAGGPGSGFVALAGGYGTLEELMEMATWNQLGIHGLGVCVYNVNNYWTGLLDWVKTAVTAGFIQPGSAGIIVEAVTAEEVVQLLREYKVAEGRLKLDWNQM